MEKIKDRFQGCRIAKVLSLLAALVMPICVLDMGTTDVIMELINPYYLFSIINAVINFFFIFIAFMGGVGGPLLALLQMIIPIVPWLHIFG